VPGTRFRPNSGQMWGATRNVLGTYSHSLDDKGRLTCPRSSARHWPRYRNYQGIDNCLFVYSLTEFEAWLNASRSSHSRSAMRSATSLHCLIWTPTTTASPGTAAPARVRRPGRRDRDNRPVRSSGDLASRSVAEVNAHVNSDALANNCVLTNSNVRAGRGTYLSSRTRLGGAQPQPVNGSLTHAWRWRSRRGHPGGDFPDGRLLGLDADPQALEAARQRLTTAIVIAFTSSTRTSLNWLRQRAVRLPGRSWGPPRPGLFLAPARGTWAWLLLPGDGWLDMRYDPAIPPLPICWLTTWIRPNWPTSSTVSVKSTAVGP